MKTVLTLAGFVAVLVLAGLAFIYSGVYDVSASSPDAGLIQWALETTQERSVHRAAEELAENAQVPNLDDPGLIRTGLVHYHAMCVTCHGAPGVPISEIGQGLSPYPPELAAEAEEEEPAEVFWVVKNGIKMTGMPAFGVTHSDEEIWAITAFLKRMPKLSPQEYGALVKEAGLEGQAGAAAEPGGGGHHHAPGTPPHEP
ncbi:MAG TPA: cytochrome c [Thermoanaerobaculia bacterium]|nr:cytochrome c [Thermoanaerobaculia bacterium]